ncbi:MAG: hypothetical protein GX651_06875 [Methanomicrobiales archaeon]|nr:hypothetical protein [Methanomicrobiales archaeon]
MKIREMMKNLLADSPLAGTYPSEELVRFARSGGITGVAQFHDEEKDLFLAFVNGEPEGAIYVDEKGELYGDNAVMMVRGTESFALHEVPQDIVDAMVMGCRIFKKSRLETPAWSEVPEFGTKSAGLGNLTLVVQKEGRPENGVRVTLRKDGQIVGSDVTTGDGSAGFRLLFGSYDCVLQDRAGALVTRQVRFGTDNPKVVLEL